MNIFICGQKAFGRACAKALIASGHKIVGGAVPEPGKEYDKLHSILLFHRVENIVIDGTLRASNIPAQTDIIVACHSHHFISSKVRGAARLGAIGYHPSLLPRHRGRDAVRWTAAFEDRVAGGTIYELNEVVDGGDILLQRICHTAPGESYKDLWREKLFPMGVEMVRYAVENIERLERTPQDERYATFEPAFDRSSRVHRPDLVMIGK